MEANLTVPGVVFGGFLLGLVAFGAGCGSTKMTTTGTQYDAKDPGCDFKVFTTIPDGKWEEIAIIDVNPGGYGSNVHTDIDDFKTEIRPKVCAAGGDAVLAAANGYGMWIKATVLKSHKGPSKEDAPKAEAASEASAAGCKFDTQCKGDRICVEGSCVDPKPAAQQTQ